MESSWSLEVIFSTVSIILEIWGFYHVIKSEDQRKKNILSLVFLALFIFTVTVVVKYIGHQKKVEYAEYIILKRLGTGEKTVDQLNEEFFPPDFFIMSEALDNLIKNYKVDHRMMEMYDERRTLFRVRIFYLNPSVRH